MFLAHRCAGCYGIAMPERSCPRHGSKYPCSCAMGNLYRFVEPVLLLLLKQKGQSHGYELASDLNEHALTDSEIEIAALYRTLRNLESNGCVRSHWVTAARGPARRQYVLTAHGEQHLQEWITVLDHMSKSMKRFVTKAQRSAAGAVPSGRKPKAIRGFQTSRA